MDYEPDPENLGNIVNLDNFIFNEEWDVVSFRIYRVEVIKNFMGGEERISLSVFSIPILFSANLQMLSTSMGPSSCFLSYTKKATILYSQLGHTYFCHNPSSSNRILYTSFNK